MSRYLETAFSPAILNHAWRSVRNESGYWSRDLPLAAMKVNIVQHIGVLRESILKGAYQPEPMRCFEIDKADGGKRLISASFIRDKLAQRAILTVLEPQAEKIFHPDSFGYRPYCSREMACARVREWVRLGWHWLGDADVSHCFDYIQRPLALKNLLTLCDEKAIVNLVDRWLASFPKKYQIKPNLGLPQGMVLSPLLCNLYLDYLDQKLSHKKIPFVRFADDFIVFGRSAKEAEKNLEYAGHVLNCIGLTLHPEKSRVIQTASKYSFLGYRLPTVKKSPITQESTSWLTFFKSR